MVLAAFDTLEFVDELEKSGIPEKQARAVSSAMRKSHESLDVATKGGISDLHHDMDTKHESLRKDIDAKFADMKFEILKWMVGLFITQTGLLLAVILAALKFLGES